MQRQWFKCLKCGKQLAAILLTAHTLTVVAAPVERTGIVEGVSMEAGSKGGSKNNVGFIKQSQAWNRSTGCAAGWAYFNATSDPHLAATALSAYLSNKPLRVLVDDSLPQIGSICQVINLSF